MVQTLLAQAWQSPDLHGTTVSTNVPCWSGFTCALFLAVLFNPYPFLSLLGELHGYNGFASSVGNARTPTTLSPNLIGSYSGYALHCPALILTSLS